MNAPNCPDREEIARYLLGSLGEDDAERLEDHIGGCEPCEDTIVRMESGSDTVIEALRSCRPIADVHVDADPFFRAAVEKARDMRPRTPVVAGKDTAQSAATHPHVPETGQLGNYRLLKRIGRGGMGVVYQAVHLKLDKPVALKVLTTEHVREDLVERFKQERRAIGALDHPNLVSAYDADETPDGRFFYLAMELIEGTDAEGLVKRCGPLPVADACQVIRQTAVGLAHAHGKNLFHRDVKPSNLMVTAEGDVKILDFGLARLADRQNGGMTVSGMIMGTPDYVSPEQANDSRQVDARSDIYSLGCTLFKLLTGRPPFDEPEYVGPVQKILAHAEAPVPSLLDHRNDAPVELVSLVERMMAKKPDDRPNSAAEVAQLLTPLAEGGRLSDLVAPEGPSAETDGAKAVGVEHRPSPPAVSAPKSQPSRKTTASAPRQTRLRMIAIALSVVGLLLAAAFVVRLATDRGELVIESDDAGIEIVVKRSGKKVRELTLKQGTNRVTLWAGEYEIELAGAFDDIRIGNDGKVELTRRGETKVKVYRDNAMSSTGQSTGEPGGADASVIKVACGEPLTANALVTDPAVIEGVSSWTIETTYHRGVIHDAAFSPDGRRFASIGTDGTVRVWDVATGALERALVGLEDPRLLGCEGWVQWSTDGRRLVASGNRDWKAVIHIWEVETGKLLGEICPNRDNGLYSTAALSPDGKTLAVAQHETSGHNTPSRIGFFDIAEEGRFDSIEVPYRVDILAWSPDGSRIATGGWSPKIDVWDFAKAKSIAQLVCEASHYVHDMDWSPDGKRLAVCRVSQGARIWTEVLSTEDGHLIRDEWEDAEPINWFDCVRWSIVGDTLAFGASLWDVESGKRTQGLVDESTYRKWTPQVELLDCTRDGRYFVTVTHPSTHKMEMQLWDTQQGKAMHVMPTHCSHHIFGSSISPDGQTLVTIPGLHFWDVATGRLKNCLQRNPSHVVWVPGTRDIIFAPGTYRLLDAETGRERHVTAFLKGSNCYPIGVSSDGTTLARYHDSDVDFVNLNTGQHVGRRETPPAPDGTSPRIVAATWLCGRRQLVTLDALGRLVVWDGDTASSVKTVDTGNPIVSGSLASSPDGRQLAVGPSNITIWDTDTWKQQRSFPLQGSICDLPLAWSADGLQMVSADYHNNLLFWDVRTAKATKSYDRVSGHQFTPDLKLVATPHAPGCVRLWCGENGKTHRVLVALNDGRGLTLTPEGQFSGGSYIEREVVYVVQTDSGQDTLTPAQFESRYPGRKNDPARVLTPDE